MMRAKSASGEPLPKVLYQANASVIYADSTLESDPVMARMLASPRLAGWRLVASGSGPDGPWRVLVSAAEHL